MNTFMKLSALAIGGMFVAAVAAGVVHGEDAPKTAAEKPAKEKGPNAEPTSAAEKPLKEKGTNDDAPSTPEKLLKDKGLTKEDRRFLLDEAAALKKYDSAKSQFADYQKAMEKLAVIVQYDETVQAMEDERQAMQQQNMALQAQVNGSSRGAGRMQRMVNAQLAPLRQQISQNQAAMNQMNAQIQASKQQAPKADDRKKVLGEVDRTRQGCLETVRELNELVAPLLAQYHELALDKSVTNALVELRRSTTRNYKLGPSDKLLAASRMVQEVKKSTTGTGKPASKKKAKAKGSAATKTP